MKLRNRNQKQRSRITFAVIVLVVIVLAIAYSVFGPPGEGAGSQARCGDGRGGATSGCLNEKQP